MVDLVAGWALREHRFLPGGPREGEEPDRRGRFLRASVSDQELKTDSLKLRQETQQSGLTPAHPRAAGPASLSAVLVSSEGLTLCQAPRQGPRLLDHTTASCPWSLAHLQIITGGKSCTWPGLGWWAWSPAGGGVRRGTPPQPPPQPLSSGFRSAPKGWFIQESHPPRCSLLPLWMATGLHLGTLTLERCPRRPASSPLGPQPCLGRVPPPPEPL